jgi:cold shock CspA family protein
MHDSVSGATTLVSVDGSGNLFHGGQCGGAAISGDGRWVAFHFIISKTKYHFTDNVYVKDTQTGALTCASVDPSGAATYLHSIDPAISADGGFVAFYSNQDSLVTGDVNGKADVVVRDMTAGVSSLASVDSSGGQGNGDSSDPAISADGRFVAFTSVATNLVASDTNGHADVFVHDMQTGTTTLVSVDSSGNQADADCLHPWLSADGRLVSFESAATNLVPGDSNGVSDVFVHDLQTGTTQRWSVDSTGAQGNGASSVAALSADGRFGCFKSYASNFAANDTNGTEDVFLHGSWLTLEADPATVTAGDTLALTTWRAEASTPVMLVVVGLNGAPLFVPVVIATCDATGEWSTSASVPSGLAGNAIALQTYAIVATGKVDTSAPIVVTIQ